jgi:predicted oxidoreductase (fatty acid repression mutant protein)
MLAVMIHNQGDVMSSPFIEQIKVRRTIYALGDQVTHSEAQLTALIKDAIKHSPSSFNSQSSRAVILFGEQHHKLWDIVKAELKKIVRNADQLRIH